MMHVSRLDPAAVDDGALLDHAHREAGQVEVAFLVEVGHLGGLAAQQGAAGLPAAFGNAFDQRGGLFGLELAHGEVIEEEEGAGAGDQQIVHRHGDQVDARRCRRCRAPRR